MPDHDTISLRRSSGTRSAFSRALNRIFIKEKLNNWVGWLLMALIAGVFAYLLVERPLVGYSLFGLVFGLAVVIACMVNTELGLYINICYSFFICQFSRYLFHDEFPIGVFTDVLLAVTFLSLLFKDTNLKKSMSRFTRTPIVVAMLVLLVYLTFELFNPLSGSFGGWFQSFRRFLDSVLLLFIAYNVFTSMQKVKRFIVALFILSMITALYGIVQQVHGLFDFELVWVQQLEGRFGLYFISGDFRKFSTMSDPAAFGIAMGACGIFYTVIGLHDKRPKYRFMYFAGVIVMLLAMAYSGTRTANVMVVGGILMYLLLSIDKRATQMLAVISVLVFLALMYSPYSNPTLTRFRTSFNGTKDDSYKVRVVNRSRIQPYIQSHPFGGGLGTTGASGERFTPNHELAGFPPDSGYLRKALETGYIGLAIVCILYFIVLRFGVRRFFRTRQENFKALCAACISSIFAFYLAEFGQEAIGQISDIVIYYPMIAILLRVQYFPGYYTEKSAEQTEDVAG
jgi:putative inorganic carbon (hco3(-)) transporter